MSIKTKLGKLERRAQVHYDVLVLPDGSEVKYPIQDASAAFIACLEGEDHWLLPHLRRAEPKTGLPGLVWALEAPVEVTDEPEG